MASKNFKIPGLTDSGLTVAGVVTTDSSGNISSSATLPISQGGTGQTTANNAINALLPTQTSSSGYYLQTNGTNVSWVAVSSGTTPTDSYAGTKFYVGTTTPSSPNQGDVWLDNTGGNGTTLILWQYTAAGGETSLSGSANLNGTSTLSYTVGQVEVYINGIKLIGGTDYVATNGTSITSLTALTAGDVVEVLSYGLFQIVNAIPSTTFTAKGDILAATANNTYSNLAVGADGTTLVANSSSSTGVAWAGNQAAGKNACINGGFDIWQRGTSSSSSGFQTADRWYQYIPSGSGTYSQETSLVPTGFTYASKFTSSAAGSAADWLQSVETLNAIQFAGKVVTISCYIAASASTSFSLDLEYSTSTDYSVSGGSWTGVSATTGGSATVSSTTYTRLTGTYTVPSTARTLRIGMFASGMANGTIAYITGYQLELGAAPTTFTRAGGTLQGELAACQRYYQNINAEDMWGAYSQSTQVAWWYKNAVTMRTNPTPTYPSSFTNIIDKAGVGYASATSIVTGNTSPTVCLILANGAGSASVGQPAGYVGSTIQLSAEL